MNPPTGLGSTMCRLLAALALTGVPVHALEPGPLRMYEVTTELGMPHLEENLRYSITHEKRCLTPGELYRLFPILSHPSLSGCALEGESKEGDRVSYGLVCAGGHGTTGNATWQIGEHQILGTLNVKLGGKNMTFYQRVTALPLGNCSR